MSTTPISLEQYFNAAPTVTDTVINAESPQPTSVLDPLRTPATLPSSDEDDKCTHDLAATLKRVGDAFEAMSKDQSINDDFIKNAIKAQGYKEIMPGVFSMEIKSPAEPPKDRNAIPADIIKSWKDYTAEVAALYVRAEKVYDNMKAISYKYPTIFDKVDRPLRLISFIDGNYKISKNYI